MIKILQSFKVETNYDWLKIVKELSKEPNTGHIVDKILTDNVDLREAAIRGMATNQLAKEGAKFIQKFGFEPHDFPEILERLKKSTLRWHMRCYQKKGDEHEPLWKIEDLFDGKPDFLAMLAEDLVYHKQPELGKAIAMRNGVYDMIRKKSRLEMEAVNCEEVLNIDSPEFTYGPLSEPKGEYF